MNVRIIVEDDKTCTVQFGEYDWMALRGLSPESAASAKNALLRAYLSGKEDALSDAQMALAALLTALRRSKE